LDRFGQRRKVKVTTINRDRNLKRISLSRRRFVQGLVAGGLIAGFDLWRWPAWAMRSVGEPAVLTGNHFDLVIDETPVNFTGRSSVATAINGSVPGPLLDGAKATR
jgi:FtsP/CotA-like multicopper oxidase with cupredoxin domain